MELKDFIDALDKKQRIFLRWLIVCYYNKTKCRTHKYLPSTFNKTIHFGYDFVWHEVNGWPELIENNDKLKALQIEIGRHSQFQDFIKAKPHEIGYNPDEMSLESTLSEFEQILMYNKTIDHRNGTITRTCY